MRGILQASYVDRSEPAVETLLGHYFPFLDLNIYFTHLT